MPGSHCHILLRILKRGKVTQLFSVSNSCEYCFVFNGEYIRG